MAGEVEFLLFTDGACSGNPGPGGWAYILKQPANGTVVKKAGAERDTTNNRMELTSAIEGLKALPPGAKVELVTDSSYVAKGISEWISGWKKRGWNRQEGRKLVPVKNVDLWKELDQLVEQRRVKTRQVKGHAGHAENEECDRMAVAAYLALANGSPPFESRLAGFEDHSTTESDGNNGLFGDLEARAPAIGLSQRVRWSGPAPISYMMEQGVANPALISLAAGLVDQETLPVDDVRDATIELLADAHAGRAALQYGTTDGDRAFRNAILEHIAELEGVEPSALGVSVDQVIVGTGSQQLLYLAAEILLDPGDIVLVTVPGYFVFMGALESFGVEMVSVPTDRDGLVPDKLEEILVGLERRGRLDKVKLLYDVTYFNNPTGLSLSAPRRAAIVRLVKRFSKRTRIHILEDAAYRELWYEESSIPSLLYFDDDRDTVLYAGTFSKPFAPGLKTGYIVVPNELRVPMIKQKGHHDFGSAHYSHCLLERVMASGAMDRHRIRLRDHYRAKRDAMLAALEEGFADFQKKPVWTKPEGGLYVWLELSGTITTSLDGPLMKACLDAGVLYVPGEFCYPRTQPDIPRNQLRLSFGSQPVPRIEEGVRRLCGVLKERFIARR